MQEQLSRRARDLNSKLVAQVVTAKFEKGQKVKYHGKDAEVVEVAKNGKVTIRSQAGATKTFKPEDAEKQLKAASMVKEAWRNQKKFTSLEDAIAFLRKFEGRYFTEFGLDKSGYDEWTLSYTYEKW